LAAPLPVIEAPVRLGIVDECEASAAKELKVRLLSRLAAASANVPPDVFVVPSSTKGPTADVRVNVSRKRRPTTISADAGETAQGMVAKTSDIEVHKRIMI
jgi:hypothetical protein